MIANHLSLLRIVIIVVGLVVVLRLVSADTNAQPAPSAIYLPLLTSANGSDTSATIPYGPIHTGPGTFYDYADGGGNCLFEPTPNDLMVAAMNHFDYDNSALCGTYARVDGPDGSVTVRIVDRCADCPAGHIDLSIPAFAEIAEVHLGRVQVQWQLVSPPLSTPIVWHFKDGSNPWWAAVQVRNHRTQIATVEWLNNGTWVNLPRAQYNFFVAESGMGKGPFTLRVTDIFGRIITDSQIPLLDNASHQGPAQFPPPP